MKQHHFAKRLSEHGWEGTATNWATLSSFNQKFILNKLYLSKYYLDTEKSEAGCTYQMLS